MSQDNRNASDPTRYVPPVARMDRWSQVAVRWLAERGVSVMGSRVLVVPGRKSGTPRRVVVNLMPLDGERYLVSPRGNTQWVRNVRAAGGGELGLGRRTEQVVLTELPVERARPGPARLPRPVGLGGRPLRRGPDQGLDRRRARGRRPRLPRPARHPRPRRLTLQPSPPLPRLRLPHRP